MQFNSSVVIFCITNILLRCFVRTQQVGEALSYNSTSKTCLDPISSGLCRGKLLRYAYDNKANRCVSFYYSGCVPTHNNFLTYEECRRDCLQPLRY